MVGFVGRDAHGKVLKIAPDSTPQSRWVTREGCLTVMLDDTISRGEQIRLSYVGRKAYLMLGACETYRQLYIGAGKV